MGEPYRNLTADVSLVPAREGYLRSLTVGRPVEAAIAVNGKMAVLSLKLGSDARTHEFRVDLFGSPADLRRLLLDALAELIKEGG